MTGSVIAITGATGYIGRRLLAELIQRGEHRVKILSRDRQDLGAIFGGCIEVTVGDMLSPDSLRDFLEPGCTVVNLAYLWEAGENANVAATRNLLEACRVANVSRLLHCSTADVVGRTLNNLITESTACQPVTGYSIAKHKVEETILDVACHGLDIAILRPTAVFGPEGKNLKKLADDLMTGNRLRNYLKSCLFGKRRMNLVHVANVVASILFLVGSPERLKGDVFIVSDDDSPSNNFADVERFLMREFNITDYGFPRLPIPLRVLDLLLICLGRNSINPRCNYSQDKLTALGFRSPVSFEAGLAEYAAWYRSSYLENPTGVVA